MADRSTIDTARAAKRELSEQLAGRDGVTGIGIGKDDNGAYALDVLVTNAVAAGRLPEVVGGVRVRSRVVGSIRAH